MRPLRMILLGLSVMPRTPVLGLKRVVGYLLQGPLVWRYARAWRRFLRQTHIDETCWLGPNAWCSTYGRRADPTRVEIRAHSVVRGILRIESGGRILVDEHCYVGDDCILDSAESITIGKHSLLAHGVSIFDNDSHPLSWEARAVQNVAYRGGSAGSAPLPGSAPVRIGEHVWIGFNSFVSKGVTVGDRSVVAACSVVTKDVPPDTLVAGNPARVIRQLLPDVLAR